MTLFKKNIFLILILILAFVVSACGQPQADVSLGNDLRESQNKPADSEYNAPVADSMPDFQSGSLLIRTFSECVAAGNTVLESDPRQCWTAEGEIFVDE